MVDLEQALDVARRAAHRGATASLAYFEKDVAVERKADQSPVTAADKASETAILEVLRAAFPDFAVLSEESGALPGRKDARWIVDPLDGTKSFIRGLPFWGPLIALELSGELVLGVSAM